jgi:N-acetylated-alpha-linked acidic dipeptidase
MASIPGHIRDEVVLIGCHRDGIFLLRPYRSYFLCYVDLAWVLGAADPTSGTVSLHEIIRGFGALLKKGWKPLRTGNVSIMLLV